VFFHGAKIKKDPVGSLKIVLIIRRSEEENAYSALSELRLWDDDPV